MIYKKELRSLGFIMTYEGCEVCTWKRGTEEINIDMDGSIEYSVDGVCMPSVETIDDVIKQENHPIESGG